jgi:hypothetical protein
MVLHKARNMDSELQTMDDDIGRWVLQVGIVARELRRWGWEIGASSKQIQTLVALLQEDYLRIQPVPNGSRAWSKHPQSVEWRHHYYCQLARVLGWKERRHIDDTMHAAIKDLWPDLSNSINPTLKRNALEEESRAKMEGKRGMYSLFFF